jgi:hypothetical protein
MCCPARCQARRERLQTINPNEATEAITASSAHYYPNWAKERIDEMDAVLASLEGKAQIATESRATAEKIIADLRAKRAAFSSEMKRSAHWTPQQILSLRQQSLLPE